MTTAFSYEPVGATGAGDGAPFPPAGFRALERSAVIGHGEAAFTSAVDALLRWQVQLRSGMRVDGAGTGPLRPADTVTLRIPFGPFRVSAPARVVYLVEEPRRVSFAYGTLPGHPEVGEEAFSVEREPDDRVVFRLRAFWRAAGAWRLVRPAVRLAQIVYTRRYLRSLATPAAAARRTERG